MGSQTRAARRALIPRWIRGFSWMLCCFLVLVPALHVWNQFSPVSITVYAVGFSVTGPVDSPLSLGVQGILLVHAIAAAMLLWGAEFGVVLALGVGFISLGLSCFGMGAAWAQGVASIEFSPVLQIPFIVSMSMRVMPWFEAKSVAV